MGVAGSRPRRHHAQIFGDTQATEDLPATRRLNWAPSRATGGGVSSTCPRVECCPSSSAEGAPPWASTRSDQPSDPTFNSCCFATCSRRSWPKGMCGSQLAALLGSGHTPWGAHSLGGMVGTCPAPSLCARLSLWSSGLPQGIDFGLLSFYGQECFLAHGHLSAIGQSWGCVPSPAHCAVHMTSTLFRLLFLPAYRGCPADCSLAGLLPGPTLNLSTC